jgi:hypothetical protein
MDFGGGHSMASVSQQPAIRDCNRKRQNKDFVARMTRADIGNSGTFPWQRGSISKKLGRRREGAPFTLWQPGN